MLRSLLLALILLAVPASAQPLLSPSPDAEGYFGADVATVPDTDGDGVADVFVGAYREEHAGLRDAGRAYLYSGATGALLHTLASPNPEVFGFFGWSVGGVPDLDGDGHGDLVVGAPYAERTYDFGVPITDADGRVYVFSGASGALIRTLTSPADQRTLHFGWTVSGIEDLDGDGRGDLLIGEPHRGRSLSFYYGTVDVFSGATGALIRTLISPDDESHSYFAWSLDVVPDADGDGLDDILVGAPLEDEGQVSGIENDNEGRAYLFSGGSGAVLTSLGSPNAQRPGYFGWSVAGVPDTDGDGRGELLVGAPYEEDGASPRSAGRAYLFDGDGTLVRTLTSPNEEVAGLFGFALTGVPNPEGSGRGGGGVGAFNETPAVRDAGRAYLFDGDGALVSTLTSPDPEAGGNFGYALAAADLDGDGQGDVIASAYREGESGRVYRLGAGGTPLRTEPAPVATVRRPEPRGGIDACAEDVLLVGNDEIFANELALFDPATGDLLDDSFIQSERTPNIVLHAIPSLDRDGVLAADPFRDLLWEFDCTGNVVRYSFAAFGDMGDVISLPTSLRASPDRTRLWVGMNDAVAEFDDAGNYLGDFIEPGILGTAYYLLRRDTDLLITDPIDDTVKRFDYDGSYLGLFTGFGSTLNSPRQAAQAGDGHILVAGNDAPSGVYDYTADGDLAAVYDAVEMPVGVFELAGGNLFVTNENGAYELTRDGLLVRTIAAGDFQYAERFPPSSGACEQTLSATLDDATPAPGQTVTFTATAENGADAPVPLDLWLEARRGGTLVQRTLLASGTLPPGASVTRTVPVGVPVNAPGGAYAVTLALGTFPDDACDAVDFAVTVQGSAAGTGVPFEAETVSLTASLGGEAALSEAAPEAFALHAAYPNPFARRTTVGYDLPEPAAVRLVVYDVLGRTVAVIVDGEREAGRHEAVLEAGALPSGTYLVRLEAGAHIETRRVTVVR